MEIKDLTQWGILGLVYTGYVLYLLGKLAAKSETEKILNATAIKYAEMWEKEYFPLLISTFVGRGIHPTKEMPSNLRPISDLYCFNPRPDLLTRFFSNFPDEHNRLYKKLIEETEQVALRMGRTLESTF